MSYQKFIESKQKVFKGRGMSVEGVQANFYMKPFQKHILFEALQKGKYAIFAECGLGKTLMQLDWAQKVSEHKDAPVLILCPLAVKGQTIEEGGKFGIDMSRIDVLNYEQIENVNAEDYAGIVLDESSILKNFEGKFRNALIKKFQQTPFKLACTATPSPNDEMEIGNHSEFLDVMKRTEMLAKYFVHDGGNTSQWRIKRHAEKDFYAWMRSWSIMLNTPGDIGFSDEGYILPSLNYITHTIEVDQEANGKLFKDDHVNATSFNQELRNTMEDRMNKASEVAQEQFGQVIIWINQNAEGDRLKELLPNATEVRGDTKEKEQKLLAFARGEYKILITKRSIAQFGLNLQNCSCQIHASLDFSFEGLYQAVRRSYRFGQDNEVNVHLIVTDTMGNVLRSIEEKEQKFRKMKDKMNQNMNHNETKATDLMPDEQIGDHYLMNGDAVQRMKEMPDESVGLSIFSPPFAELYTYSDYPEDMGNSHDYQEFVEHFKFLVKDLYRVTKQGRNVAIHCMDLPIQKGKEGYIGLRDFSGIIREAMEEVGFIYHSRITIWKNPVTEMTRTKALGLLHKQTKKDSTMSRVGIPDYVLVFRKDGERADPVQKEDLSVDAWQKLASPVWMDIDYGNTLNYREGKHRDDEKHIAPLQLETIERLIYLYSNHGDTVFDPFLGIGTVAYKAIETGRVGKGIELKPSYFQQAIKNCKSAVEKGFQMTLI